MILSDVVAIALSIIGFLLSLQGLWLVCRALWPTRVESAANHVERHGKAAFFLGLIVSGILLGIGIGAARAGARGKMLGFVILFFYVMFSGVGTAGFVTHIGRRLESPADAGRSWRATVRGGVALELACLIPVLGWFGLLPMSLIIGAGAATMAMFSSSRRPQQQSLPSNWSSPPAELPRLEPQAALR